MHRIITMSFAASLATLSLGGAAFAQQAPQSPNMTFFVASNGPGKGGDLGGMDAADARCQSLADGRRRRQQGLARLSELVAERLGQGDQRARPYRQGPVAELQGRGRSPRTSTTSTVPATS